MAVEQSQLPVTGEPENITQEIIRLFNNNMLPFCLPTMFWLEYNLPPLYSQIAVLYI